MQTREQPPNTTNISKSLYITENTITANAIKTQIPRRNIVCFFQYIEVAIFVSILTLLCIILIHIKNYTTYFIGLQFSKFRKFRLPVRQLHCAVMLSIKAKPCISSIPKELHIINFARSCISSMRSIAYHQADRIHT